MVLLKQAEFHGYATNARQTAAASGQQRIDTKFTKP